MKVHFSFWYALKLLTWTLFIAGITFNATRAVFLSEFLVGLWEWQILAILLPTWVVTLFRSKYGNSRWRFESEILSIAFVNLILWFVIRSVGFAHPYVKGLLIVILFINQLFDYLLAKRWGGWSDF